MKNPNLNEQSESANAGCVQRVQRVVRRRGGKFKILFARNSVFECFSPPCGRIKAEIFAWLYRMKGEGRQAMVVDAKPTPNDQAHLSAPGGRVERNQKEQ